MRVLNDNPPSSSRPFLDPIMSSRIPESHPKTSDFDLPLSKRWESEYWSNGVQSLKKEDEFENFESIKKSNRGESSRERVEGEGVRKEM